LLAILPVDKDRVYVQGHSLGGMATWEWATDNPERFAAIAPRSGIGEPYRAIRLRNIPSWVIHGEKDNVVPSGFADQMVTALQSYGAPVRYTVVEGGEHNMPPDLDFQQIRAWFLRQTRSSLRVPADPRDSLGINSAGFSPWETVTVPETPSWKSGSINPEELDVSRGEVRALFQRVHDRGELVDAPIRELLDTASHRAILWLAVPKTLHAYSAADPLIIDLPQIRLIRFYFRGPRQRALEHAEALRSQLEATGHIPNGRIWITNLSLWQDSPDAIAEYCLETS
jgi:Phospholipase/Carboxylesterase